MDIKMVDVTLHIDEAINHDQREALRDQYLQLNGVMAADYRDDRPHLMIIEYNPDQIASQELLELAKNKGLHAELIGM